MGNLNRNYASKIFRPNKQNSNPPGFLGSAVTKVTMTDTLLPYIARTDWEKLEKIFYQSLHSYEKYTTRPIQVEDANDEDTADMDASTFQDSNST
jgi:hypothetical protein